MGQTNQLGYCHHDNIQRSWSRWSRGSSKLLKRQLRNVFPVFVLACGVSAPVLSQSIPEAIIAPISLLLLSDETTDEMPGDMCESLTTSLVKSFELPPPNLSFLETLTGANGSLFFAANDGVNGVELWKSDGSAASTAIVKDINTNANATSSPSGFTEFNGMLFFSAFNEATGNELWKSDGTEAGTVIVKNIRSTFSGNPSSSAFPSGFEEFNGKLYFSAKDNTHGTELWLTDGSDAGTIMVKDISNGGGVFPSRDSNPQDFTEVNGELFFSADDGETGTELWKTDGSNAGTVLVKNINPDVNLPQQTSSSAPRYLTEFNDMLIFEAIDGVNGAVLWKSDGTSGGTSLLKAISQSSGRTERNFTEANGMLFFTVDDGVSGTELWKTDGTTSGTVLVKDINPTLGSGPSELIEFNNMLFFSANDGVNGAELWKSDGTEIGTVMVKNIGRNGTGANVSNITEFNGMLFFGANDNAIFGAGQVLWQTDGTADNTVKVTTTLGANYFPSQLTTVGDTLFFRVDDAVEGIQLWKGNCQ